jgi:hypothetical protein
MRQLKITKEQLIQPTIWEVTGKSPGNTPQAKLQAAQLLLQAAANPALATGLDAYELVKVIVETGALANATNVQISKDQMEANARAQQQAQPPGAPSGPGTPPNVDSVPGGSAAPFVPNQGSTPSLPAGPVSGPAPIPAPSIPGPSGP